jgi:hypothetical protein
VSVDDDMLMVMMLFHCGIFVVIMQDPEGQKVDSEDSDQEVSFKA